MAQPKILIVDDEPNVRLILEKILKNEGYFLDTAHNGTTALQKLADTSFDLLLLDLYMEGLTGLEVLQSVRSFDRDLVVIILTAQGSMESAVEGLRQGAFDYLFKPADPEVIRKRVRDGLDHRRKATQRLDLFAQVETINQALEKLDETGPPGSQNENVNFRFLCSGKLIIDRHHREATLNKKMLDLTTTEFDILSCLVSAHPMALSPQELVKQAMGYDASEQDARSMIKYHIHNLRKKIEKDPSKPRHLKTVRYKGYLWVSE